MAKNDDAYCDCYDVDNSDLYPEPEREPEVCPQCDGEGCPECDGR